MQIQFDGTPVMAGDVKSVLVIFNNLGGVNFNDKRCWDTYVAMMNDDCYVECPLKPGMRVELSSKGVSYGAFVYGEEQFPGFGDDDIARIYQQHQPHKVFTDEDTRSIYEQVCEWRSEGKTLTNPFSPGTEFQKFQAYAWGQFRVMTGEEFLNLRKLHAASGGEQERALYTSICEWSPWYGDAAIGPRLKEEAFQEPSLF